MTVTIMNLYESYAQATEAVSNLEKAGTVFCIANISIDSNNSDNRDSETTARRTSGSSCQPSIVIDEGRDDRAERSWYWCRNSVRTAASSVTVTSAWNLCLSGH